MIWLAPALVGIIVCIRSLSLYYQGLATNRLALSVMRDLQTAMYARLIKADFARLQGEAVGTLISRFTNDITMLRESLVRAANNLMRDSFTVIASVAVMIYLDWVLALMVLVIFPLAGQPVLKIGKAIRKRSTAMQTQMGDVTSFLEESFSATRMVKTFALEDYAEARAKTTFWERFKITLSMVAERAKIEPVMELVGGLAIGAVFAVAGWRAASGASDLTDLLGFIGAIMALSPAARALGSLSGVIQEGLSVLDRVFSILDETPKLVDQPNAKPLTFKGGHIRFDAVSFAYSDGSPALKSVTIEAEPGQTIALVGPSGSGKTTVLNLIPRLYDVSDGVLSVDGQDVRTVTLSSLRARMALVSQDITLFDDTVRANIALGRLDADEAAIVAAAKAADAHDFIMTLPQGYDTPVGPKGSSLSGGQRQRLSIARAILKDAPILLLDEATSALDAQSEARVQAALDRLAQGRTSLIIAHRLSTVRHADQIYVMSEGEVRERGTHETLLAQGGLYADLVKLQLRETR